MQRQPTSTSTSPKAESAWEAVKEADAYRPLLDIALVREAAKRGPFVRLGSPTLTEVERASKAVEVLKTWREVLPGVAVVKEEDRWYRWLVRACFFRVGAPTGTCEVLDVRARSAWASATAPTGWPVEVIFVGPAGGVGPG